MVTQRSLTKLKIPLSHLQEMFQVLIHLVVQPQFKILVVGCLFGRY